LPHEKLGKRGRKGRRKKGRKNEKMVRKRRGGRKPKNYRDLLLALPKFSKFLPAALKMEVFGLRIFQNSQNFCLRH